MCIRDRSFSAHIDQAVLKAAPMLSHHKYAAVFKCIDYTVSCCRKVPCVPGKQASPVRSDPWFNRLFHRTHTNLIAWFGDIQFSLGDPLITFDVVQSFFFVNGQRAISK